MTRQQLVGLCLCQLAAYTSGSGAVVLFALHGSRLGADTIEIGNGLALLFFALAVGALVAGRLSDRLHRRKLIILSASLGEAAFIFLMSQASTFGQLSLMLALAGFFAGVTVATVSILAGLFVSQRDRGRVFGLIAVMTALGQVISGAATGPIVDRWGFPGLYVIGAAVGLIAPLAGFLLRDSPVTRAETHAVVSHDFWKNRSFLLLIGSCAGTWAVVSIPGVLRPLMMDQLHFDATAISSANGIASAFALPLPFVMGWLSDRTGRKSLLVVCFLANAIGLFLLIPSTLVWHFWLAACIQNISTGGYALGPALVTDMVKKESVGSALAAFSASLWVGQIVGSMGTGIVSQQFGVTGALVIGVVIALLAVVAILPIAPHTQPGDEIAVEGAG